MCGRFNIEADPLSRLLMELVGFTHPGPDNPNTAPTETVTVLRLNDQGNPELVAMRWWLTPYWSKEMSTKYSMFNAKSETLAKSRAFREPFRKRRCVVPVSGFYEWVRTARQPGGAAAGQPAKLPYYITPSPADAAEASDAAGTQGLLLAGLWDRWRNRETGDVVESFTVVTTAAHPAMELVHNRQPVMLSMSDARRWLDPSVPTDEFDALFGAVLPVQLDAIPVSSDVNNARHKDQRCTDPIGEPIVLPADPIH